MYYIVKFPFYRIVRELEGEYGFKRFLGDGFGSEVVNQPNLIKFSILQTC